MRGLGGSMLFGMSRPPAGYMVKAVLLAGRDVTDTPVGISGTEELRGLQVVLTRQVTDYLAVALDYLEDGQSEDPEFLETLRPSAVRFTLADGESKSIDLKVASGSL